MSLNKILLLVALNTIYSKEDETKEAKFKAFFNIEAKHETTVDKYDINIEFQPNESMKEDDNTLDPTINLIFTCDHNLDENEIYNNIENVKYLLNVASLRSDKDALKRNNKESKFYTDDSKIKLNSITDCLFDLDTKNFSKMKPYPKQIVDVFEKELKVAEIKKLGASRTLPKDHKTQVPKDMVARLINEAWITVEYEIYSETKPPDDPITPQTFTPNGESDGSVANFFIVSGDEDIEKKKKDLDKDHDDIMDSISSKVNDGGVFAFKDKSSKTVNSKKLQVPLAEFLKEEFKIRDKINENFDNPDDIKTNIVVTVGEVDLTAEQINDILGELKENVKLLILNANKRFKEDEMEHRVYGKAFYYKEWRKLEKHNRPTENNDGVELEDNEDGGDKKENDPKKKDSKKVEEKDNDDGTESNLFHSNSFPKNKFNLINLFFSIF